jgi:hypothetical protein
MEDILTKSLMVLKSPIYRRELEGEKKVQRLPLGVHDVHSTYATLIDMNISKLAAAEKVLKIWRPCTSTLSECTFNLVGVTDVKKRWTRKLLWQST